MKRTQIFSMIVFTAATSALLMYWYMRTHGITTIPEEPSRTICENYDHENMSTLDVDLVHTMVDGYKNSQLNFIESNHSFSPPHDAKSIWFDLLTLKKFLYHIENISKKTRGITLDKLGVRIYYATYPDLKEYAKSFEDIDAMQTDPIMKDYGNVHTLVMIPTIEIEKGVQSDFNPLDVNTYETGIFGREEYLLNSLVPIPNSNPSPQLNVVGALSSSARHTGARNHGVLSPPGAATGAGF